MTPFKIALALFMVAAYAAPEPMRGEAFEPPIIFVPAPKTNTGDNSLVRQEYARRALEEHLKQLRTGVLEEIRAGLRCWCCKELHSWSVCGMNPKAAGRAP